MPPTLLLAPIIYRDLPAAHLPATITYPPQSIGSNSVTTRRPHFYSPRIDKMLKYTQIAVTNLFIRSIHLFFFLSIYLSLSICLCASIRWPVHLSTHLPYLSPYPPIYLCPSVYLHASVHGSNYVSISIGQGPLA